MTLPRSPFLARHFSEYATYRDLARTTSHAIVAFIEKALSKLWMFISVVAGVFAAAALFGWIMYRSAKSMDRAERDPKYKRRLLYIGASIYAYGLVAGVAQVLSGDAPPATLLAAPIPLLFVWFYLRAAKRVKIPPD